MRFPILALSLLIFGALPAQANEPCVDGLNDEGIYVDCMDPSPTLELDSLLASSDPDTAAYQYNKAKNWLQSSRNHASATLRILKNNKIDNPALAAEAEQLIIEVDEGLAELEKLYASDPNDYGTFLMVKRYVGDMVLPKGQRISDKAMSLAFEKFNEALERFYESLN